MTLPVWPVSLPACPLREAQPQKAAPALIKSDMGTGLVRQRRRFSQTVHEVGVWYLLTPAQYQTFKSFWRDTLGHGASLFTGPVWDGVAVVTRTCQIIDGIVQDDRIGTSIRIRFSLRVIGL